VNKSKLKAYAPTARREFIQAVTDRAHFYGLSENKSEIQPIEEKGDFAFIGGRPFPRKIAAQRKNLEQRIEREGLLQVMEAVAYTWFNRFLALRYMEVHGYLDHGYRVLSNPSGSPIPEILEQAAHVQLPGIDHKKVVELKLDGNKDAELYRILLVAQCNALNTAMPFLFERIDDETELLLPDNLLHSDSLIRKLVTEIDDEDWQQVEIIGWLYQFYISEKKDQVIGKVVKPEDIPAATQLFTPNWIVKYMVHNSLGRMWLATYPNSSIKGKMEYYIEPAEQTDEVNAQLSAITPKELNPETITLLDPASGSGHILVEAYNIFKEIYLERGYRSRDIPRLILEKNLYGLDIDDRAAQMAGFALLMKARADDRRILKEDSPRLNVMAIQSSEGIDAESIANALLREKPTPSPLPSPSMGEDVSKSSPPLRGGDEGEGDVCGFTNDRLSKNDIKDLLELFKQGKNFGSLIQIPEKIAGKLRAMANLVESNLNSRDIFTQKAANTLLPIVRQAMILAGKYDYMVANPPYMGSGGMNEKLKIFAKERYQDSKSDLFAMFIERGFSLAKPIGFNAMVTMHSWMFLSSFETMRKKLLADKTIITMAHLGARAFGEISGEVVQTTSFVLMGTHFKGYRPVFFRLVEGQEVQKEAALRAGEKRFDQTIQNDFKLIPGSPIAYWVSKGVRKAFEESMPLFDYSKPLIGMRTGDNERFLRSWHEISLHKFSLCNQSDAKWFPYTKGGEFRRWYGNLEYVVNWFNNGYEIKENTLKVYPQLDWDNLGWKISNEAYYFKEAISWTCVCASLFSARYIPEGTLFDTGGSFIPFSDDVSNHGVLSYLNTKVAQVFLFLLNPTINYGSGTVGKLPWFKKNYSSKVCNTLIEYSKSDWNSFETSWDFQSFPLLAAHLKTTTVELSYLNWEKHCNAQIKRMQELETENNRLFIEAYGMQEELTPEVSEDQITLARADREADVKRLISYAVGCMMGRYSLDRPGLIYAHSGNKDFWEIYNGDCHSCESRNPETKQETGFPIKNFGNDKNRVNADTAFLPDEDGIIPIMDMEWFEDDIASRFEEFLRVAWSTETLEENMKFVADSLSPKAGETP
jgi:type II restriction/modification system DNA methylase subunit YeeA